MFYLSSILYLERQEWYLIKVHLTVLKQPDDHNCLVTDLPCSIKFLMGKTKLDIMVCLKSTTTAFDQIWPQFTLQSHLLHSLLSQPYYILPGYFNYCSLKSGMPLPCPLPFLEQLSLILRSLLPFIRQESTRTSPWNAQLQFRIFLFLCILRIHILIYYTVISVYFSFTPTKL